MNNKIKLLGEKAEIRLGNGYRTAYIDIGLPDLYVMDNKVYLENICLTGCLCLSNYLFLYDDNECYIVNTQCSHKGCLFIQNEGNKEVPSEIYYIKRLIDYLNITDIGTGRQKSLKGIYLNNKLFNSITEYRATMRYDYSIIGSLDKIYLIDQKENIYKIDNTLLGLFGELTEIEAVLQDYKIVQNLRTNKFSLLDNKFKTILTELDSIEFIDDRNSKSYLYTTIVVRAISNGVEEYYSLFGNYLCEITYSDVKTEIAIDRQRLALDIFKYENTYSKGYKINKISIPLLNGEFQEIVVDTHTEISYILEDWDKCLV